MRFYEQDGILISTRGCYHLAKEIIVYNEDEGWICFIRGEKDFIWLDPIEPNAMRLAGSEYPINHNFSNDQMQTDKIRFDFCDLETETAVVLESILLEEPDRPGIWYVFTPDEPEDGNNTSRTLLDREIKQLKEKVAKLKDMSQKHSETEIRCDTALKYIKMFKCPPNDDGLLFEFWDSKPDYPKNGLREFEDPYEKEILFVRSKQFFPQTCGN